METENKVLNITTMKVDDGTVCLDFRSAPNMAEIDGSPAYLGLSGYVSVHFQLSPKDAEKLGAMLIAMGPQK